MTADAPRTAYHARTEEVRGVIVGGDYVCGRLYYQGRPQGRLTGATDDEVIEAGRALKRRLVADCGEVARLIYPTDEWEVRIYA